ncbi:MAG: DUF4345 domain-containing protein [Rhodobacteraceae bacterium]|nr:DUF4345 domain-containing protein [Paracoccaceae bacterium]
MAWYSNLLKLAAPIFVLVGALHLVLGLGADVLLGAKLSQEAMTDPVLDSQNRFYGVSFTLYGVLLFLCASDLPKYKSVLRCVLWVFFAGGLARLVSFFAVGAPSVQVIVLAATELLLPPILLVWLSRLEAAS